MYYFCRFSQPIGNPNMALVKFKSIFQPFLDGSVYDLKDGLEEIQFEDFEYIDIELNEQSSDKYYKEWSKLPFKNQMKFGGFKHPLEEQGATKFKMISWEEQV